MEAAADGAGWAKGALLARACRLAQLQACATCAALCALWAAAAARRRMGAEEVLWAQERAREGAREGARREYPAVSVVVPTRGVGSSEHALRNLLAQLRMGYDGPVEFLFGVEDDEAPECAELAAVAAQHAPLDRPVTVVPAGAAVRTSQKIANQLACLERVSAGSEYVLFLDDDMAPASGLLAALVDAMDAAPEALLATGFPFDVPVHPQSSARDISDRGALARALCTLAQHATMWHHLPLLVPFSLFGRGHFVWGGCMLFRAPELARDAHGIVSAWRDGGYSVRAECARLKPARPCASGSQHPILTRGRLRVHACCCAHHQDDLVAAATSVAARRPVLSPAAAFFPQRLEANTTLGSYWNYLRRQLYVLFMYAYDDGDRYKNRVMATVYAYLSVTLFAGEACAMAAVARALARALCGGYVVAGVDTADAWLSAVTLLLGFALAHEACSLTRKLAGLSNALSPESPTDTSALSLAAMVAAMALNQAALPLAMVYTALSPAVVWGGRRYRRRRGKVHTLDVL